jgi:hypothetical protein
MGQLTQDHRSISITDFSLGKDTFLLTAIDGSEYISDIFDFQIEVLSEDLDISPEKIIGKTATVTLKSEKADRKINGYINAFGYGFCLKPTTIVSSKKKPPKQLSLKCLMTWALVILFLKLLAAQAESTVYSTTKVT